MTTDGSGGPTVGPPGTDQLSAASQSLAEAFFDDPLMLITCPDPARRSTFGTWFFERALVYGQRWGEVYVNEDATAVAIWFPPGETEMTPMRMLKAGMGSLPFKAGLSGTLRFFGGLGTMEKFHKSVRGPHWYLMALGTKPSLQGKGLGSALVKAGTAQADAAGIPCYLETGTDSNIAFYQKRGFEIIGQVEKYGFKLTGMVRQPQAP